MVLAQFEGSQDYKLKAKNFHDCGLELSRLYNKLRTFKTLNNSAGEYEVTMFCKNLSEEYQTLLSKYDNHHPIDYENFKINHLSYFNELTKKNVKTIKRRTWMICYGWYTIVIILPPIMFLYTVLR